MHENPQGLDAELARTFLFLPRIITDATTLEPSTQQAQQNPGRLG
jgi:hypothetical protein